MRRLAPLLVLLAAPAAPAAADAGYTFSTIDAPGAASTTATGINDLGQVVGSAQAAPYGLPAGFLLSGSSYSPIALGGFTLPQGINDAGQVVGTYGSDAPTDGFLLSASGAIITIHVLARVNSANGVDGAGLVVGAGVDAMGRPGAFSGDPAAGFSALSFATGVPTHAQGIDGAGDLVVGWYTGASGPARGFLLAGGSYRAVDVPGAAWTEAYGVNDLGQVVGQYADASGELHGFLLSGGAYTALDAPGASSTGAYGINDLGQVVGGYTDASGARHGFLASDPAAVPEPSSLALCGLGLAGAAVYGWKARRRARGRAGSPEGWRLIRL